MRLPVAEFTLVEIPSKLVNAVTGIDTSGLNPGIGFGSFDVGAGSRDMEPGDLDRLPESILAEILAFDLWIQNSDRILSQQGGNPNVVIGPDQNEPFLIDHDNAFDPAMTHAYNTGTIELMPYPEHGEFVIVGVFAVSPDLRSLHYKLLAPNKTKRLTQFFPELERRLFPKVLKNLRDDWEKLNLTINRGSKTEALNLEGFNGTHLFKTLTRPREGMVRQQARATILTKDIDQWLGDAFARMVHRADPEASSPEEQRLVNQVQNLLTQWKVNSAWKKRKIGNDDYHATFPFTYQPEESEKVNRAIKPLYLGQNSATKILDHGDFWLQKVRRLQHFKLAPEVIIFPIELPDQRHAERADNADLVVSDLKKTGVKVIDQKNISALKRLTTIPATEGSPLFSQGA